MKASNKKLIIGTSVVFLALLGIWIIPANFEIVPNYSESLPYRMVLVKKGRVPTKKDQAFVFYVRNNPQLGVEKIKFIKLVGGLPGDKIEVKGGSVYFDGNLFQNKGPLEIFLIANIIKINHPEDAKRLKIKIEDREILVGGRSIGIVKIFTKKFEDFVKSFPGEADKFDGQYELHPIGDKEIPAHKFFAYTPHKDSFDSRYQEIGLIDEKDIVGTVIFTF